MRTLCFVLLLPALGLLGCDDPNPALSATATSVEMGTGETAFEVVPDGTTLSAVFGGQGGRHVWGSMRLGGMEVSGGPPLGAVGMTLSMGIEHAGGPIGSVGPFTAAVGAASGEYQGATIFLDTNWDSAPFLYPPGFSIESDSPTEEEWEEAEEFFAAQLASDLRLWVSIEDADGNVHDDECLIGLEGLTAYDYGGG